MSMNKKTIETLSVNAVRDSVVMSEFLDQYIPDDDKEPFWDGAVYIYNNKKHTKNNFKGRMPVQVKGTEQNDLSNREISFSVSTTDLRGYLNDGGAIFFVVYIANRGLARKIYYIELTPIKIRLILDEAKNQSTKSIKLKEFPTDNDQKATVFFNCLQNCQKQASFGNAKLYSFEELLKKGILESITIPLSGIKIDKDPEKALISNDIYFYANIKGSSIPQPLYLSPCDLETRSEIDADVKIEGKQYYSKITVVRNSIETKYIFGESLIITAFDDKKPVKINYEPTDKVQVLANDLDFMLSFIEYGYFEWNGMKFPFDYKRADFSSFDVAEQKRILNEIQDATRALNFLGCSRNLSIKSLTKNDFINIDILVTAFVKEEPVSNLRENISPISIMKIGNVHLLLAFIPVKDKKGCYVVKNLFDSEMLLTYKGRAGENLPLSPYAVLNTDVLIKADNIRYESILSSYKDIEHHEETFERANFMLLDLLNAYDKTQNKNFLSLAKSFSSWIMEAGEDEFPYNISLMNKYQIIKRERELNESEIENLYKILDTEGITDMELTGVHLLLGQQIRAKMYFDKLSQEDRELFKDFPIYTFWRDN